MRWRTGLNLIRYPGFFLGLSNFYWHYLKSFSKIGGPLISMLRTSSTIRLAENLLPKIDEDADIGDNDRNQNETIKRSSYAYNLNKEIDYLTLNTRKVLSNWDKRSPILLVEVSYLISDDWAWCHPVAHSLQKLILKLDTKFDTQLMMVSFLTIVEGLFTIKNSWLLWKPLKTWRYYLEN